MHAGEWPVLSSTVLDLLAFTISSANVERAFSMLHTVNYKKCATMILTLVNTHVYIIVNPTAINQSILHVDIKKSIPAAYTALHSSFQTMLFWGYGQN